MKNLYLIRHAKSSWDDPYQKDFDRPLNKRGKRDAPEMGKRLKEIKTDVELMLTSPAERAIATCRLIAAVILYEVSQIKTDKKLYHASEDDILSVVRKLNDHHNKVMIFGHNPGITDFINSLSADGSITDNLPTCGVVCFKLNITSWKDVQWEAGVLELFDFPKKEKS